MKIYLDMCCMKRPFDDQSDARIQMETTALAAVLVVCHRGDHELFSSDALRFENSRNPNPQRQDFAARVLAGATHDVPNDTAIEQRAAMWQNVGIELLDALHLASAEIGEADAFATTDDVLLHRAARLSSNLRLLSLLDLFQEITS
jgi:hypothetical protein